MNKTVRRYKRKPWSYWHRKNALRALLTLGKAHGLYDPETIRIDIMCVKINPDDTFIDFNKLIARLELPISIEAAK